MHYNFPNLTLDERGTFIISRNNSFYSDYAGKDQSHPKISKWLVHRGREDEGWLTRNTKKTFLKLFLFPLDQFLFSRCFLTMRQGSVLGSVKPNIPSMSFEEIMIFCRRKSCRKDSTHSPADTFFKWGRQSCSFIPIFGKQFYTMKTRDTTVQLKIQPLVPDRWKLQGSGQKNKKQKKLIMSKIQAGRL